MRSKNIITAKPTNLSRVSALFSIAALSLAGAYALPERAAARDIEANESGIQVAFPCEPTKTVELFESGAAVTRGCSVGGAGYYTFARYVAAGEQDVWEASCEGSIVERAGTWSGKTIVERRCESTSGVVFSAERLEREGAFSYGVAVRGASGMDVSQLTSSFFNSVRPLDINLDFAGQPRSAMMAQEVRHQAAQFAGSSMVGMNPIELLDFQVQMPAPLRRQRIADSVSYRSKFGGVSFEWKWFARANAACETPREAPASVQGTDCYEDYSLEDGEQLRWIRAANFRGGRFEYSASGARDALLLFAPMVERSMRSIELGRLRDEGETLSAQDARIIRLRDLRQVSVVNGPGGSFLLPSNMRPFQETSHPELVHGAVTRGTAGSTVVTMYRSVDPEFAREVLQHSERTCVIDDGEPMCWLHRPQEGLFEMTRRINGELAFFEFYVETGFENERPLLDAMMRSYASSTRARGR